GALVAEGRTVPAGKLTAFLNGLPQSAASVRLEGDDKKVVLRSGRSQCSLATQPAADYPSMPVEDMPTRFTLPAAVLHHLLQMVRFAMAQQDVRYYLNGALLEASAGGVRAVTTDGHRLACCDAKDQIDEAVTVNAILPRKTVLMLTKLLPENDTEVTVEIGAKQVRFTFGDISMLSKLVEGQFPDYNRVIPVNNDKNFLVNREELIGALRRCAIVANEKFKGQRWIITPGKLQIESTNGGMEEAVEEIAIDYEGEELDMGFNVTYLLDVLGNLKNAEVRFAFSSSQGATLLTLPESDRFRYVLMPMRI
ncbi:MAG: DNA polymerase III subunit beta, partial [Duodenibacillus sp.]|nr:DNA polymerase III subunit beta [Duodenibacillus sp.]